MKIQTALRLIYPPRCVACGEMVESDFGLCGSCWRDTPFIEGLSCDLCGVPLPGESDQDEVCDDCRKTTRPWRNGRAVFRYAENGRRLVLALKHGDRHDIVRPAAKWLARRAEGLIEQDTLITPVPLHWTRLLKRRFNQSALLAEALAKKVQQPYCPDLLIRCKRTDSLEGKGHEQRFATVTGAIEPHPKRRHRMVGRHILIVDDVMTSGATMAAATEACLTQGARDVSALVLARVAKED
ncbi:ComF family protein [Alisedimentitalea sp. MJ-SS2]|uniref:ComF family protein n=1 Tax=Aliisedimentitalea sp. MJ-SS2 TaxID=3049795 RepID=UPI002910FB5B|nr:ComF family protein [Alisedimentitalea sp. MJ-SS2]MDU8927886.1 ComF family protein [Alisedimentitalea sp. MJ-SS2]